MTRRSPPICRALLPRRRSPPGIPLAAVPATACAVVSHNHYDHLDAWTVERLPAGVRWFVPLGLLTLTVLVLRDLSRVESGKSFLMAKDEPTT